MEAPYLSRQLEDKFNSSNFIGILVTNYK